MQSKLVQQPGQNQSMLVMPHLFHNPQLLVMLTWPVQDPVRKEVPDAVAVCKRAGIFVRMVTGDNVHTASHIARECGIMMEGGLALEGPTFRKMTEEELIPILPKIQVRFWRCLPHMKIMSPFQHW